MPNLGESVPWSRMNYNPVSTELALSASIYSASGLAFTSPLCAGTPLSLTQVAGSAANPVLIGYPVVNTTSGYVYAIQSGAIDYVAPPPGCSSAPSYTIGGSVSGLASGTSATLLDNGGDSLTVSSNTSFTFPTALDSGAMYAVTVGTQPTGETCTVANGTGTVASSNITNVSVACSSSVSGPAQVTDNETITVSDGETFPDVVDSEAITVTDSEVVRAYNAITITPSPATFNASNGNGYATYAYSVPFTATGGIGTLTLTESGALPAGLTFTGTALSGTPEVSSVGIPYTFSVTATDADGDSVIAQGYSITIQAASAYPAMVTDNETITVSDAETFPDVVDSEAITVTDTVSVTTGPVITGPASLPAGTVNVAYTPTTITAGGGSPPYTWTAAGLPPGLTTGNNTGTISGTPTAVGTYSVTVTVKDANGVTAPRTYTIAISALPLTITTSSLPASIVNVPYPMTTIIASGGTLPYTWTITGLPPGLTTNGEGVISGTPTADVGSPYSVKVTVTDAALNSVSKTYSLTVSSGLAITGPASLPAGIVGVEYAATTITASGGSGVYTWSATGLPTGLSIAIATGVISGTPTSAGTSSVTVTVTDSNSSAANKNYSLTVSSGLAITGPASLPAGIFGVAYAATTITASGGSGVYTWSATGLPTGLSIAIATGVISGTPTSAGTSSVTVTVTDSNSSAANKNYPLTVIPPPSLTVSASPVSLTIVQGQTGQTTITLTPQGIYSGTLTLTCSGLPANTLCQFKPTNSVVFTGVNDQPLSVVLTIETDVNGQQARVKSAPMPLRPGAILAAIAFLWPGSLLGLMALRRKRKLFTKNPGIFGLCVIVLLAGGLAGLAGCVSGGGFGTYVTPAATSSVTVVVTPVSGSPQTVTIGLTITQQ